MALPSSARGALAGAALAAAVAGLLAWAASPVVVAVVAGLAGGLLGWLLDRRLYGPLRQLHDWLQGGDDGPAPTGGAARVNQLAAAVDRVRGDLERRIGEAEAERRNRREILEAMADGVLVIDAGGRFDLMNPAFGELLVAPGDRPGGDARELPRSALLAGFLERLEGATGVVSERFESAAGRTLELRGRPLAGGRKVVVARDLTEQLRLDETRRALVANVSHELRTPLTAIRGYAENLRDGAVGEPVTAERFLDRILAQCGRLEALLEDLLALARLERQEPIPLAPAIDLVALVERSLETVRGLAAERRVELRFSPTPVPPIAGNEESLEQLMLNLLENAIKYNRVGGSVRVGLAQQGGEIVLEVADGGIGVPQRDLPRIFERFYRVDRGRSREEGGTGLGLAIVKHAAQLHGGRVEVESELGRGSVFRVHLPVAG